MLERNKSPFERKANCVLQFTGEYQCPGGGTCLPAGRLVDIPD